MHGDLFLYEAPPLFSVESDRPMGRSVIAYHCIHGGGGGG